MSEYDPFFTLARKLGPESYPFMSLCHNPSHGWKPILAWDPINVIETTHDQGNTVNFFTQNKNLLIAGFFGYETGMRLHGILPEGISLSAIPGTWFGAYENWAIITDGKLEINGKPPRGNGPGHRRAQPLKLQPMISRKSYNRSIERIKQHIIDGNIYQVNLTHFLSGNWNGDPWNLFKALMKRNPVNHAACLLHPDFNIISLSPEKFISIRKDMILTEPIKGTRPRGRTEKEDANERSALLESRKEAAELNMITDLLRNDLGKICKTGSVEVLKHRETIALSNVWHTYSVIKGVLPAQFSPVEAVLSLLPGGSITGCPKKRAIEIINKLEQYNRNLYTGTIGIQFPDGSSDWNIAIRTLLQEKERVLLGVGGGITIDSNAGDEYLETLAKAGSFMGVEA